MTTHERLIELVPDIVALKAGCKVKRKFGDDIGEVCEIVGKSHRSSCMWKVTDHGNAYDCEMQESQFEVLGRDITLADVLLAISLHVGEEDAWEYAVNADGFFIQDWGEMQHETSRYKWNLTLPFHQQPQETQDFIGRIIGAEV